MRHIITIIVCLIVILSAVFFQAVGTQNIVDGYAHIVEFLGQSQLTSKLNMIGERYNENDDYTGGYMCNAENVTGQDVAYGGCSIEQVKIKLKGKINVHSGDVNIRIRCGSEVSDVIVDENGCFDEQLEFNGGGNYIMVQYKDFTGDIDMQTEYI